MFESNTIGHLRLCLKLKRTIRTILKFLQKFVGYYYYIFIFIAIIKFVCIISQVNILANIYYFYPRYYKMDMSKKFNWKYRYLKSMQIFFPRLWFVFAITCVYRNYAVFIGPVFLTSVNWLANKNVYCIRVRNSSLTIISGSIMCFKNILRF